VFSFGCGKGLPAQDLEAIYTQSIMLVPVFCILFTLANLRSTGKQKLTVTLRTKPRSAGGDAGFSENAPHLSEPAKIRDMWATRKSPPGQRKAGWATHLERRLVGHRGALAGPPAKLSKLLPTANYGH
jgi:hypothetical protein